MTEMFWVSFLFLLITSQSNKETPQNTLPAMGMATKVFLAIYCEWYSNSTRREAKNNNKKTSQVLQCVLRAWKKNTLDL